MSIRHNIPEGADLDAAAQAFDEASNLDMLILGIAGGPSIAFGRLYAYATEAEAREDLEGTSKNAPFSGVVDLESG